MTDVEAKPWGVRRQGLPKCRVKRDALNMGEAYSRDHELRSGFFRGTDDEHLLIKKKKRRQEGGWVAQFQLGFSL